MYSDILYDVDDPVAVITFNRPKQLNAWTDRMGKEVRHALAAAEADRRVVGIVLTGAGGAFCSGRDLQDAHAIASGGDPIAPDSDIARASPGDQDMPRGFRLSYAYFASVRKPVVAAISGPVVGMALPIAAFCDVRFGSPSAMFKAAFPERGLIAEWGLSWILPRLVGHGHALDMLLSSRKVDAAEAVRIGLLNRIVEGDDVVEFAKRYIADMAARCAPNSLRIIKRQAYEDLETSLDEAMSKSYALMLESSKSKDFVEGVNSFLKRRAPEFLRVSDD